MNSYQVRLANYQKDESAIHTVREAVFIQEQGIPAELEWDDADKTAQHVLAIADNIPIGTGRLLTGGQIGRMAVLATWRGKGVGTAMLQLLLSNARQHGYPFVTLSAQCAVIDFYQRNGFYLQGEPYHEVGIPHQQMRCDLT